MKKIVVGYDGSDLAERALERAAELAEGLSATLVVVSVAKALRSPVTAPSLQPENIRLPGPVGVAMPTGQKLPLGDRSHQHLPEAKELAEHQLEQARRTLGGRRLEAVYVAEVGSVTDRLLEVADDHDADLIVVGHSDHGIIERLLARSVDETVARRSARDVLLVH